MFNCNIGTLSKRIRQIQPLYHARIIRKQLWSVGRTEWYPRQDSPVLARASRPHCARPLTRFPSPPARSAASGCRSFASNPSPRTIRFFRSVGAIEGGSKGMVPPTGFEPVAYGLGNHRSIQLSYGGSRVRTGILHRHPAPRNASTDAPPPS